MKSLIALLALSCVLCRGGTLFCGAYPDLVLVVDEAQGKVIDKIKMVTGLPRSLRLSPDRKTIYVSTNDHNGFEVIDVATHKVTNHFVLDDATHRFRVNGGAPDPQGKVLYTSTTEISKQSDRYVIGRPKYTIIDLDQQKIVKTVDTPANEGAGGRGGGGRGGGGFEVSPDGKYLYQFGSVVTVLNSADFSVVERIDLELSNGMPAENLGLGGMQEALSEPGQRVSLFNVSDPIVHNRVFGLARFDLNTRKFEFTPIGPSPAVIGGLFVTPDKKMGYTMSTNGTGGNKRCEFWGIDLTTTKLARTAEVPCRTRYSFGISSNGRKLYIYAAGYQIEVYDAVTFKLEDTWDLGQDMTGAMVVLP
jgi:DNA-binding beta-propeller fold protein YncE